MRKLLLLVGAILVSLAGLAGAADFKEGKNYTVYNPPRSTEVRDKIEITEFFWYGCGHCFHLDPALNQWVKKLPKDVSFRRVPALFSDGRWGPGAKIFYTLEAMGLLEKLHGDVFAAIHTERINLFDEKVLFDWMAKKGVDGKKFADTYSSFAIQSKLSRSMQLTQTHGLDGVPAMIVDGRYLVANAEDTLPVVDYLIEQVRKDRAKK
jgi:thiol:disulfide interchange protein DsbA